VAAELVAQQFMPAINVYFDALDGFLRG